MPPDAIHKKVKAATGPSAAPPAPRETLDLLLHDRLRHAREVVEHRRQDGIHPATARDEPHHVAHEDEQRQQTQEEMEGHRRRCEEDVVQREPVAQPVRATQERGKSRGSGGKRRPRGWRSAAEGPREDGDAPTTSSPADVTAQADSASSPTSNAQPDPQWTACLVIHEATSGNGPVGKVWFRP